MWEAILALFGAIAGAIMNAESTETANSQNISFANQNREDQQAYNTAAAEAANAETRAQYWDLYSPKSKVKQLKDAGLSVGLMYGQGGAGGGGGTAAQAAPANTAAPVVNPILNMGMLDTILNATKTPSEIKKTEADVQKQTAETEGIRSLIEKQNQEIEESKTRVKLIEAQTGGQQVTNTIMASEKELKDLQVKVEKATVDEKIQLVEQGLEKLKNDVKVAQEQAYQMKVDSKYKEEMNDAILTTYKAQYWKLYEETILTQLQQETEQAKTKLTQAQTKLTAKQREYYETEIKRASYAQEMAEEELRKTQNQADITEKENQYWWVKLSIDALKSISQIAGQF